MQSSPSCLDDLAIAQANIRVLTELFGYPEPRFEEFVFELAARSLELEQGMEVTQAEKTLQDIAAKAKVPLHAFMNQLSHGAIKTLANKTSQLIAEAAL